MSSITECNYCTLRALRAQAKEQGKRLTLLDDAAWGMGGTNVYIHPPHVDIASIPGGEDGPRARYRVAWLMEISERCCC